MQTKKQIYSFNLNFSDYIELKANILSERNLSLLVDLQADVCLIKLDILHLDIEIDTSEIIEVTGVVETWLTIPKQSVWKSLCHTSDNINE